jgi:hypothetical protein
MMKVNSRPLPLKNAPLQYAPDSEMGVVYLFANIAKKLQFRIEAIRCAYPDCIAYRQVGDREKLARIEFEFKSSNFKLHGHDPTACDYIVCWHHDCATIPRHIEVIELKRFFGVPFKIWIQAAIRNQWEALDANNRLGWALSTRVTYGDLVLMYRCYPQCSITDLFLVIDSSLKPGKPGWKDDGKANFGRIQRLCSLDSPVFLSDMRHHKVLRTAPFIRANMQGRGGLLVSEYWPYLYAMLGERNPKHRRTLAKFAPEKLSL